MGMGSANARRRCIVTSDLIGQSHTQSDPCSPVSWSVLCIMHQTKVCYPAFFFIVSLYLCYYACFSSLFYSDFYHIIFFWNIFLLLFSHIYILYISLLYLFIVYTMSYKRCKNDLFENNTNTINTDAYISNIQIVVYLILCCLNHNCYVIGDKAILRRFPLAYPDLIGNMHSTKFILKKHCWNHQQCCWFLYVDTWKLWWDKPPIPSPQKTHVNWDVFWWRRQNRDNFCTSLQ